LEKRRQMLVEHRQVVIQQISELKRNLKAIDHKIDYYNSICSQSEGENLTLPLLQAAE
jgi:hypothetical protein